ncbi:MAG: helix-turn-helix domain-containing protein [Desulfovibrionaceae bacterium]|nr:helix-turn-helix domain-containing protein [Desulfovibrionaceae bacterium]MBF0514843.1 helix-turn-helix domain-containing protein [Desulfovibrionaceae bacterium]
MEPTTTAILDENQAAAYLGLSVKTLQSRRCKRRAPVYVKLGKSVRYKREDLDQFIAAGRIDPEAA